MNYTCNMYVVIIDAFFDSSLYMYCPCRLRCMLGNSFSWACSVVHQRFTRHTKYLWLFGYFPSPLNKMINKNILMISSDDLKKEICYFLKMPFECKYAWIQNMIAYDISINQLHKLWTEKLKWKRKKSTSQSDIIITPESEGMSTVGSSTVDNQIIKQSSKKNLTKPDTSWSSHTLVHGAFLQHWVKNAGSTFYAQQKFLNKYRYIFKIQTLLKLTKIPTKKFKFANIIQYVCDCTNIITGNLD